jgi:hypothetical protein
MKKMRTNSLVFHFEFFRVLEALEYARTLYKYYISKINARVNDEHKTLFKHRSLRIINTRARAQRERESTRSLLLF